MSNNKTPSETCLLLYHFHLASNWNKSVNTLKFINLVDEPDRHALQHDPQTDLDLKASFPNSKLCVIGSTNGLICLNSIAKTDFDSLYICNPTTREYITLPKAEGERVYPNLVGYGFGSSPLTNTFKVVRIYQEQILVPDQNPSSYYKSEFQVYTLGGMTGTWRSAGDINCFFSCREWGISLDGKLHWLVYDANGDELICSFDLENEAFQTRTSAPPPIVPEDDWIRRSFGVLGNRLCVCDNTAHTNLDVWVMKEYGNGESWAKEICIVSEEWMMYEMVHLVKDFKDGEILFLFWEDILFSYNPKRKSLKRVDVCEANFSATVHVPSSISLKTIVRSDQVKEITLIGNYESKSNLSR